MSEVDWNATGAMIGGFAGIGTTVVAGLALYTARDQLKQTRESAREIFARQARQQFLSLAMSETDVATCSIDLSSAKDRARYFSFLSLLFTTFEDAQKFIGGSVDFTVHMLGNIIERHLRFVSQMEVGEWQFYASDFAIRSTKVVIADSIQDSKDSISEMSAQLESCRNALRQGGWQKWIPLIDDAVAGTGPKLAELLARNEAMADLFHSCEAEIELALRAADPAFAGIAGEEAEAVGAYVDAVKDVHFDRISIAVDEEVVSKLEEYQQQKDGMRSDAHS